MPVPVSQFCLKYDGVSADKYELEVSLFKVSKRYLLGCRTNS
jgi:hypothetical protein